MMRRYLEATFLAAFGLSKYLHQGEEFHLEAETMAAAIDCDFASEPLQPSVALAVLATASLGDLKTKN